MRIPLVVVMNLQIFRMTRLMETMLNRSWTSKFLLCNNVTITFKYLAFLRKIVFLIRIDTIFEQILYLLIFSKHVFVIA